MICLKMQRRESTPVSCCVFLSREPVSRVSRKISEMFGTTVEIIRIDEVAILKIHKILTGRAYDSG